MTKRRSAVLVIVTAVITIVRYGLIAETALRAASGADVLQRGAIIAVLTVSLWFLNGVGIVALFRWGRRKFRHNED